MEVMDTFHMITSLTVATHHIQRGSGSKLKAPVADESGVQSYSVDSGGDIVKVRTKNYDELGHSEHSALEVSNVDIVYIHNIRRWCLLCRFLLVIVQALVPTSATTLKDL